MLMRAFRFLNLTILSVLVGSAALVYAQEEKPQEDKPARQEEAKPQPKQEEGKPARQEEAKPSKQDQQMQKQQDEKRGQEQATPNRQERPGTQDERAPQGQGREMQGEHAPQGQEHPQMEGDHAGQGQGRPQQRAENGKPAGRGGHIPDDKFRSHFGREHHFNARTVIVSGQPQFQYGGYSFQLVDAWPADWAYTDDCYVDYIDGEYFLIDLMHPGIRLALVVVM
jgi:hypothetical protein